MKIDEETYRIPISTNKGWTEAVGFKAVVDKDISFSVLAKTNKDDTITVIVSDWKTGIKVFQQKLTERQKNIGHTKQGTVKLIDIEILPRAINILEILGREKYLKQMNEKYSKHIKRYGNPPKHRIFDVDEVNA